MTLPVKISRDSRYFVDQKDQPIFWLGTTQWELCRRYTLDEARTILDRTAANGFTFVQVMLLGVGDGTGANFQGDKPWLNDNPLTPNEAYFKHVDAVFALARERGLVVSLSMFHQRHRQHVTPENGRAWAKWLAQRYKDYPNLIWLLHPEAKAQFIPVLRELAAGLKEGDGGQHLIAVKPDPSPHSSSFIHNEPWLAFNSIQTWQDVQLIYSMVSHDYGLEPVKPVLMGEGAYEAGSEYNFKVTPLWVRRQAYYSYFAGGHHAYGHNDSWRVLPTWKAALDAPGAVQMGVLRSIFTARPEWWRMVPDQAVLAEGGQTAGKVLHLAGRHPEGKWALVYLADAATVSVNMKKVTGPKVHARWIDPRTGEAKPAGDFAAEGVQAFTTPEGWEDAILLLDAVGG